MNAFRKIKKSLEEIQSTRAAFSKWCIKRNRGEWEWKSVNIGAKSRLGETSPPFADGR